MTIVLKDDKPVYQRDRRLSAIEKQEVNEIIQDGLEVDIIRPPVSKYASPVVLVKKKRLCVDYKMLSKKIVRDRYPLPLTEDQLGSLQGFKVFSKLDLKMRLFRVEIGEESRKYTAFIVPDR